MAVRFFLILWSILFQSVGFSQQNPGDSLNCKDNDLRIYVNSTMRSIGKLSGKLIREQFDPRIFQIDFDSTYSLTIDSVYKNDKYYTVIMTLYKFGGDPRTISFLRIYHVYVDWIEPKRKRILKFIDYGFEI